MHKHHQVANIVMEDDVQKDSDAFYQTVPNKEMRREQLQIPTNEANQTSDFKFLASTSTSVLSPFSSPLDEGTFDEGNNAR